MAPRRVSLPSGLAGRQELLVFVAGLEVTGIGDPVALQGEEAAFVLEEGGAVATRVPDRLDGLPVGGAGLVVLGQVLPVDPHVRAFGKRARLCRGLGR